MSSIININYPLVITYGNNKKQVDLSRHNKAFRFYIHKDIECNISSASNYARTLIIKSHKRNDAFKNIGLELHIDDDTYSVNLHDRCCIVIATSNINDKNKHFKSYKIYHRNTNNIPYELLSEEYIEMYNGSETYALTIRGLDVSI